MVDHRKLLERAGEALYGPRWQSELARAINVSDRTMRRWVAEPYEIPSTVWDEIGALLGRRRAEIDAVQAEIRSR